jgi:subtilisin family serine protease
MYVYRVSAIPNDPAYRNGVVNNVTYPNSFQRWIYNGSGRYRNVNGEAAWNLSTGRSDVVIAVIDTGVLRSHPDLQANMWFNGWEIPNNNKDDDANGYVDDVNGWDFCGTFPNGSPKADNDPNPDFGDGLDSSLDSDLEADNVAFHGTFVAGVAAARGNNSVGIAGAAWNCRIMALKVIPDENCAWSTHIAAAIRYATDNGALVINISLEGYGANDTTLKQAVAYAMARNVTVVAAAGNQNKSDDSYPASYPGVISVGATRWGGDAPIWGEGWSRVRHRAVYSQYGASAVDVVAPGNVYSTTMLTQADQNAGNGTAGTGTYAFETGTSFASPLVAGLAGLMISYARDRGRVISNGKVREIILATTTDLPDDPTDSPDGGPNWDGKGLVNMRKALDAVTTQVVSVDTYRATGVSIATQISLDFYSASGAPIRTIAFTPSGGYTILFGYNGYDSSGVPTAVSNSLGTYASQGFEIKRIDYTPSGGWMILYGKNLVGCEGFSNPAWSSLTALASQGRRLDEIAFGPNNQWAAIYDGSKYAGQTPTSLTATLDVMQSAGVTVNDVAFAPSGGWVVLTGYNGFWVSGISTDLDQELTRLSKQGQRLKQVAFTPSGGWVVIYGHG